MSTTEPKQDEPRTAAELLTDHADALKQVLNEMTSVYHEDSERLPVRFGNPPCADISGQWVQVDPKTPEEVEPEVNGPLILRMLDDTLCHEMAHINWSDLAGKRDFAEAYEGWGRIPGSVWNILEDAYVDARRCREWYGMRAKSAYTSWLVMETDGFTPPLDHVAEKHGVPHAMIDGLSQLATAGYVKYDEGRRVPTAVWEFLEAAEPIVQRIRTQDDRGRRDVLCHAVMKLVMRHADKPDPVDSNNLPDAALDPDGELPIAAPGGDPADADPPDEADEVVEEAEDDDTDKETITIQTSEVIEEQDDEDDGGEEDEKDEEDDGRLDALEEHFDVEIDVIDSVDTRERQRWTELVKRLDDYDADVEERKRQRDDLIETQPHDQQAQYWTSGGIREEALQRGVIDELKQGFAQLVTRPAPRPAESGPQMDVPNVVRRASGDLTTTDLFEEHVEIETGDRCIGICADTSGSMGSRDMKELKLAAACIAKATDIIDDEFVITSFSDKGSQSADKDGSRDMDLRLVTAPDEDFEWEHLDATWSTHGTPTAAGIRDCRTVMDEVTATEHLMIVITDGKATHTEDGKKPGGTEPAEQAHRVVEECRADGVEVIGLGLSGGVNHQQMTTMFGGDGYRMTSIEGLAETILSLYHSRMHVER